MFSAGKNATNPWIHGVSTFLTGVEPAAYCLGVTTNTVTQLPCSVIKSLYLLAFHGLQMLSCTCVLSLILYDFNTFVLQEISSPSAIWEMV